MCIGLLPNEVICNYYSERCNALRYRKHGVLYTVISVNMLTHPITIMVTQMEIQKLQFSCQDTFQFSRTNEGGRVELFITVGKTRRARFRSLLIIFAILGEQYFGPGGKIILDSPCQSGGL